MQTLGLSADSKRHDGWLKSIFWPTVENAWDVDYLGQQGFWICLVIALLSLFLALFSGNLILLLAGLVQAAVFVVGGMGVREGSWPAAAFVFAQYVLNTVGGIAAGQAPGALSILAAALLLTNLRAAFLASEWKPAAEGEDRPMRFSETFRDKLVDVWPAKLWPLLRVSFFVVSSLLLLLTVLGLAVIALFRLGLLHLPAASAL